MMATMAAHSLSHIVFRSRLFGYLLAALAMTQLEGSLYLYGWVVFLMVYPHMLQWFVTRSGGGHRAIKASLLVDGVVVGLLVSLMGFQLEASVVLTAIFCISVLIVGGWTLLLTVLPLVLSGMLSGKLNHPMVFTGGSSFYFVSFLVLVAYVSFVGIQVYQETRRLKLEKRKETGLRRSLEVVSEVCAPFVPPQILSRLRQGKPSRKPVTVMFADIVDPDGPIDHWPTFECRRLLSEFSTLVVELANQHGATIDKFLGPGVMLYMGDPQSGGAKADARQCVELARKLQSAVSSLDSPLLTGNVSRLAVRIGIHSGQALIGEFGCAERRDYTAIGEVVSFASRIKSVAEPGEILLSAATVELVRPDIAVARRGCVFGRFANEALVTYAALKGAASFESVRVLKVGQHV